MLGAVLTEFHFVDITTCGVKIPIRRCTVICEHGAGPLKLVCRCFGRQAFELNTEIAPHRACAGLGLGAARCRTTVCHVSDPLACSDVCVCVARCG
jgi:hypothetical protein